MVSKLESGKQSLLLAGALIWATACVPPSEVSEEQRTVKEQSSVAKRQAPAPVDEENTVADQPLPEPIVLINEDAIAFQNSQARLATLSGVNIQCSARSIFPAPVSYGELTSCVHSDYWVSMNVKASVRIAPYFDLVSLAAIDTTLRFASYPIVVAVPSDAYAISVVLNAAPMRIYSHHYVGSASVRARGASSFYWPLISPGQGW